MAGGIDHVLKILEKEGWQDFFKSVLNYLLLSDGRW